MQENIPHTGHDHSIDHHYIRWPKFVVVQVIRIILFTKTYSQLTIQKAQTNMTRTHKWTVHEGASEQKYFTHNGHADMDPNKVRKEGSGKYNWGKPGDELCDEEGFSDKKLSGRRNSNHAHNEQHIREATEKCESMMKSLD